MRERHTHAYAEAHAVAKAGRYSTAARNNPKVRTLAFVDGPAINAVSTIAFRALGRYDEAEAFAEHDLAALPPTYVRNRELGWLHLAEARRNLTRS
jgi:hypothetical protein